MIFALIITRSDDPTSFAWHGHVMFLHGTQKNLTAQLNREQGTTTTQEQ
jgi:hypothetical protein